MEGVDLLARALLRREPEVVLDYRSCWLAVCMVTIDTPAVVEGPKLRYALAPTACCKAVVMPILGRGFRLLESIM